MLDNRLFLFLIDDQYKKVLFIMGCNRIYTVYKPLEVGVLCLECTHLTSSKEESRGTWKDVVEEPEVRRGSSREVTRSLKITRTLRPDVLI